MVRNCHRFLEHDVKRLAGVVWGGPKGIEMEQKRRRGLQSKPYSAMKRKDILDLLPFMFERRGNPEADEWVARACQIPAVAAVASSLEKYIHPNLYDDLDFGLFD